MSNFDLSMVDTSYKFIFLTYLIFIGLQFLVISFVLPKYFRGKNKEMQNLNTSLFTYLMVYLIILCYILTDLFMQKAYTQIYDESVYIESAQDKITYIYYGVRLLLGVLTMYTVLGYILFGTLYFYNRKKGIDLAKHKELCALRIEKKRNKSNKK